MATIRKLPSHHRQIPVERLPEISSPSEWKPPPVSFRQDEDCRAQLRRERQVERTPGYRRVLREWLGPAEYARESPAEWAIRMAVIGRPAAYSGDRKGRCCS